MGEGNCKSCNCGKWIVILLLALNTFFLAGIWCTLKHSCGQKSYCPLGMKGQGKFCPFTGKIMESNQAPMPEATAK